MLAALKSKLLAGARVEAMPALPDEESEGDAAQIEPTDISFDKQRIDFEKLRKKRAFECGSNKHITPVMPADPTKTAQMEDFRPIGDVLPVVPMEHPTSATDYHNFLSGEAQS